MIELEAGPTRLAIDQERGGRFSSLVVHDRELLVGPPDGSDRGMRWGCFVMAPWAGRIDGGVVEWEGRRHTLPRRDGPNAIHGLVYDQGWRVEAATATTAELSCSLGLAGWPFGGTIRHRVTLGDESLVSELEIDADECAPIVLGWHPWFLRRDADPRVCIAAGETLETRDLIPTGRRIPVNELTDLRSGPGLGDRALDHVYPDPISPAVIRWDDLELSIAFAPPIRTVVVHTQPAAFCVEPQTGWPNAPALEAAGVAGTGLASVEPGQSLRAAMTWSWRLTEQPRP